MANKRFFTYLVFLIVITLNVNAVEPEIEANIENALNDIFPDMEISSIKASEIDGLYEVMQGAEIYYVSGDGRYLLQGSIYDLKDRRNLTEAKQSLARVDLLKNLSVDEYIEFSPDKAEHTIYVFTDIDCSYCRRLHSEIDKINKLGIAVRYLAFPRSGEDTETFFNMESVWCSANRNQALTSAKLGKKPIKKDCSNPVSSQYSLGQSMGVRGTPAIFAENGKQLGGYLAPVELAQAINAATE